jgi:N-acyl-D-amino-acid deacylase
LKSASRDPGRGRSAARALACFASALLLGAGLSALAAQPAHRRAPAPAASPAVPAPSAAAQEPQDSSPDDTTAPDGPAEPVAPAGPVAFDVVIRHGKVLDGLGGPAVLEDVGIKDGLIVQLGTVNGRGRREINATGQYVAPGFIDMMDHSGTVLQWHGAAENKLQMGVTTLIAGEGGTPVTAAKIDEYLSELAKHGIAVNFGTYYSTAQARMEVLGEHAGAPTPAQLARMRKLVGIAMKAGVFGISSALVYPPDSFNSTADLTELAGVAGSCGGLYSTHVRDEGAQLLAAIDEAIAIGEQSKVRVEIYHIKAAYRPGWGTLMPQALAHINAARARGVDVAADIYPYTAAGTGIDVTVPTHLFAHGPQKAHEQLRDAHVRAGLKRELDVESESDWSNYVEASGGWDNIELANGFAPEYARFKGKSFAAIGQALHKDPADAAWDIMLDALPNRAMALYFMMDEQDIETALRQPWVSIGTDAAATVKLGQMDAMGLPHPRSYGTFPRVIAEYVRTRHVLSLEEAVRRMTSWPAERMSIADRGVIREGFAADLVVFDYAKIQDHATWEDPTAVSTGIGYVLVNGKVTLSRGKYTGVRGGTVLRHRCVS